MATVVAGAANGADGEIARIDLVGNPETGTTNLKNLRGTLT